MKMETSKKKLNPRIKFLRLKSDEFKLVTQNIKISQRLEKVREKIKQLSLQLGEE
ncbi:hypothetical protein Cva_00837 [Caedimonas varicaedens]|uniref:Uncharacterized protein n=1 Tax=Caedimonas varicaedens TaxID=1629334 RepID=A0A0K8ME89_9PROT|nr:hypothetical protein Cva_00837 [Caedimonas varicaedens]